MERAGVSPLIAAVLLIAFTMAVAAILTAWVTTFTQEQTQQLGNQSGQQIDCSFAQVDIFSSSDNANWVNVSVENTGQEDLDNLSVSAVAGGQVVGRSYIGNLTSGQIKSAEVETSEQADTVRIGSKTCPTVSTIKSLD